MNQSNGQDLNGVRPEGDPSVQGIDSSSHVMLDAGRTEGDHRSKQRVSKVGRIRFDFTEGASPAYAPYLPPPRSFVPIYSTLQTTYVERRPFWPNENRAVGGPGGPTNRGPSPCSGEPAGGRPDKRRWLSHACYRLLAWLRQFYIWLTA